jgi:hypothetical protein
MTVLGEGFRRLGLFRLGEEYFALGNYILSAITFANILSLFLAETVKKSINEEMELRDAREELHSLVENKPPP